MIPDDVKKPAATRTYKSTTDLCLVTMYESEATKEVSEGNRELRGELDAKLARFKDYRVKQGRRFHLMSPAELPQTRRCSIQNSFFKRRSTATNRITAKLLNVEVAEISGRKLFGRMTSKARDFIDEATGLIAAHIAGHDGAIHRDILKKALVKKRKISPRWSCSSWARRFGKIQQVKTP